MNAYRPRLSVNSGEWPAELVAQRKQLVRRATLEAVCAFFFLASVVLGLVSQPSLKGSKLVFYLVCGAIGAVCTIASGMEVRRRTRNNVARLLIDNGYCVCGYPYQTQGIIRSCPECGRQWTERALPRD